MALPLEIVIQQLEDSGILAGDTLSAFLPPERFPKDGEELVRELVRGNKLTPFQAEQLQHGNGRQLVLGNYVLLEKIGAGGMGEVFKAQHRRMRRLVAVKVLPVAAMRDPSVISRFEREVEAAARINHPNIVTAYDADQANGVHFLVMELIDGMDLSALVKRNGPLSVETALDYIQQTARGLEAAHKMGIVHRDIKPANLLLSSDGTVKILDLGLARIDARGVDLTTQSDLTGTTTIMGTVDYMSPEQAVNTRHADARADIYSLGCTFYYLLSGRPMYEGESAVEKILAHRERPIPSLRALTPDIAEPLDAVFRRMVAKKVEDRYQTVAHLCADLEKCSACTRQGAVTSSDRTPDNDRDGSRQLTAELAAHSATVLQLTPTPHRRQKSRTRRWLAALGIAVLLIPVAAFVMVPRGASNPLHLATETPRPQTELRGKFAFQLPEFNDWVRNVESLPADERLNAVSHQLVALNPGFDGKLSPSFEEGTLVGIGICADKIVDLSPLRALPGLKRLSCNGSAYDVEKLSDISPLHGLPLEYLSLAVTDVSDVSPLAGMPLSFLSLDYTKVTDLSRLAGLKLRHLQICGARALSDLSPLRGMPLDRLELENTNVTDLSPLAEMPLKTLNISGTRVTDLRPLKGMQLTSFSMLDTTISDISPLAEMPLTALCLSNDENVGQNVGDLTPITQMPLTALQFRSSLGRDSGPLRAIRSLETINRKPAAQFFTEDEAQHAAFALWKSEFAELPAERQLERVSQKLIELNPYFDGKLTGADGHGSPVVADGVITEIGLYTNFVEELSPLQALLSLKKLSVCSSSGEVGRLRDLSPLRDLSLEELHCAGNPLSDLFPLQRMQLESLDVSGTNVASLRPLAGQPITNLRIERTKVTDLSPLSGMPLQQIGFTPAQIVRGIEALREMKTVQIISVGSDPRDRFSTVEFWNHYDAGEFRNPLR